MGPYYVSVNLVLRPVYGRTWESTAMLLVDSIKLLNMEELRTKEVISEFPRTLSSSVIPEEPSGRVRMRSLLLKHFQLKRPSPRMQVVGISKLKPSGSNT